MKGVEYMNSMKKKRSIIYVGILAVVVIIVLIVFVGSKSSIIGTWEDERGGLMSFYNDGSGEYTYEGSFTYTTSENGILTIYIDGDRESMTYEIDGKTLILDGDWELFRVK